MRTSNDQIIGGRLVNGFDYTNQAWVVNGAYVRCGHPADMKCQCFGRINEGMQTAPKGEDYFKGKGE